MRPTACISWLSIWEDIFIHSSFCTFTPCFTLCHCFLTFCDPHWEVFLHWARIASMTAVLRSVVAKRPRVEESHPTTTPSSLSTSSSIPKFWTPLQLLWGNLPFVGCISMFVCNALEQCSHFVRQLWSPSAHCTYYISSGYYFSLLLTSHQPPPMIQTQILYC